MFNEIWQIKEYENINIDNFKIASLNQRTENRGGGVLIYIKNSIEYEIVDTTTVNGIIEIAAIKINDSIISTIYRPPSGSKNEFADHLISFIETSSTNKLYIAGDFNINYLNRDDKRIFERIETETGIRAKIFNITRHASSTCIDNIMTNIEGTHKVSDICIADHQGITSRITLVTQKKVLNTFKYREMTERNWSKFKSEVENIVIRGNQIDDKWSNLSNDIKEAVEKSFPEKERKDKYHFNMSQGLLKSKNKKNKLLRKYKRGEIPKEVYVRYNKIYRKLIARENEKKFEEKMTTSGNHSKKMEHSKNRTKN
jgi:hypothetical protein